jgi:hypothetical protein
MDHLDCGFEHLDVTIAPLGDVEGCLLIDVKAKRAAHDVGD